MLYCFYCCSLLKKGLKNSSENKLRSPKNAWSWVHMRIDYSKCRKFLKTFYFEHVLCFILPCLIELKWLMFFFWFYFSSHQVFFDFSCTVHGGNCSSMRLHPLHSFGPSLRNWTKLIHKFCKNLCRDLGLLFISSEPESPTISIKFWRSAFSRGSHDL